MKHSKNANLRSFPLLRRHNERDGASTHQLHDCLLNRLFRRRSKKTSKLRVTGLCEGNSRGPVNSPHKWPITRKLFPFDDVIMLIVRLHKPNIRLTRDIGSNTLTSLLWSARPHSSYGEDGILFLIWISCSREAMCCSINNFLFTHIQILFQMIVLVSENRNCDNCLGRSQMPHVLTENCNSSRIFC